MAHTNHKDYRETSAGTRGILVSQVISLPFNDETLKKRQTHGVGVGALWTYKVNIAPRCMARCQSSSSKSIRRHLCLLGVQRKRSHQWSSCPKAWEATLMQPFTWAVVKNKGRLLNEWMDGWMDEWKQNIVFFLLSGFAGMSSLSFWYFLVECKMTCCAHD